jgi:tetratricopeptide (TPR) repeat protein
MLYKSKMNTAIESALGIDDNNLLATAKELINSTEEKHLLNCIEFSTATPKQNLSSWGGGKGGGGGDVPPLQPQQRDHPYLKTPTRQIYSLTEEINFAVTNSDIKAVDSLYERYKSRSDATKLIQIGTAYQRLGQYDKALVIFNSGLQKYPDKAVGFLTSRVQIYELQNEWTLADGDYKRLLEVNGDTESKRKNYNFQRARVLLKDRDITKARNILFDLNKKYPTDTGIANALAEVDRVKDDIASGSDQSVEIPIIDIGDDQVEIISPMLRFDIEECDYRDESIIKQGNKPTLEDAIRLKSRAMTSIKDQVEMSERYPIFLEAAKAYNDLNPGSYDPTDIYELLARYAALRAGTIFSEIKKQLLVTSKTIDPQTAQLKADTASSYYLESVNLQAMVKPENMLLPLTNHLKIQMAVLLYRLNKSITEEIFSGNFNTIYKSCIASKIPELNELAYKSVVTIGSTNIIAWNKLAVVKGGSGLFYDSIRNVGHRIVPYRYLSNLSGTELTTNDLPGDALRKVFQARKSQNEQFVELTKSPKLIDFRPQNINNIENIILEMEKFRALFFESDLVILEKLKHIVNIFKPYETRGANERVSIIVKVRSEIFSIIEFIESNPTYWGRVAFFPILQ